MTDKEICLRFQDEIIVGENLAFEVKYEGKDLVGKEGDTFFWIESLSMATYNITSDSTNKIC